MKRVPLAFQDCATCSVRDKSVVCDLEGAEFDTFRVERRSITLLNQDRLARIARI